MGPYFKPILKYGGLALIVFGLFRLLAPQFGSQVSGNRNSPFNEMTVYVSVLESESRKDGSVLACSHKVEETFHFKDAWGSLLQCSSDDKHLYIKSAGPDKAFGTEDDLILRRRVNLPAQ